MERSDWRWRNIQGAAVAKAQWQRKLDDALICYLNETCSVRKSEWAERVRWYGEQVDGRSERIAIYWERWQSAAQR